MSVLCAFIWTCVHTVWKRSWKRSCPLPAVSWWFFWHVKTAPGWGAKLVKILQPPALARAWSFSARALGFSCFAFFTSTWSRGQQGRRQRPKPGLGRPTPCTGSLGKSSERQQEFGRIQQKSIKLSEIKWYFIKCLKNLMKRESQRTLLSRNLLVCQVSRVAFTPVRTKLRSQCWASNSNGTNS